MHNTPDEEVNTPDDVPNTPDGIQDDSFEDVLDKILQYCRIPRSKNEIADYLGIKDCIYLRKKYLMPMIREGSLIFMFPDKKTSKYQKYIKKEDVIK